MPTTPIMPITPPAHPEIGPRHPPLIEPMPDSPVSAWRSPAAWAALVIGTVIGLAIDLATKDAAFRFVAGRPVAFTRADALAAPHLGTLIPPHEPVTVVRGLLELTLVLNPGAVFGIGAGQRWFFVVFTVLALIFAVYMFGAWTRPRDRVSHLSIAMLISGGLGNLYDRLVYACVRDFLHPVPRLWPYVSNVADLLLILGIIGLMLTLWRGSAKARPVA